MSEKANDKMRLCHIVKWDNFDGYGFDLHAEKGKPGQYIGKVDVGSPAKAAGLRQGDRIIEVNGETIGSKTHKEVVDLIKTVPTETKLLVIDPDDEVDHDDAATTIISENNGGINNKSHANHVQHATNGNDKHDTQTNHHNDQKTEENGALNLNMTAAELRAKLAAKKKFDPKKETMDFKKKFDIIQKL